MNLIVYSNSVPVFPNNYHNIDQSIRKNKSKISATFPISPYKLITDLF